MFDLDFLINAIIEGASLVLLDEEACSYRRHTASISSQTARETVRFDEESRLFSELAPRLRQIGWTAAARTARMHPSSRLHALTLLPNALRLTDKRVARQLIRHVTELS